MCEDVQAAIEAAAGFGVSHLDKGRELAGVARRADCRIAPGRSRFKSKPPLPSIRAPRKSRHDRSKETRTNVTMMM